MSLLLDDLPVEDPGWLFGSGSVEACSDGDAAAFLGELEREDLHLLVLNYGLGMRVGGISQVMRLDPALVVWRLHRAFHRWRKATGRGDEAGLERGVSRLLRAGGAEPPPPHEARSWSPKELLHDLDEGVRARLEARLAEGSLDQSGGPGVGVGLLVAVLAVALGFLAFGVVRDTDPMARGETLMSQYEYARARDAFLKVGTVDAKAKIVLCLLAEGRFDDAVADLEDPELAARFGQFAPTRQPGRIKDLPAGGRALLPRGTITRRRPAFTVASGPPGRLRLTQGDREFAIELPDRRGRSGSFSIIEYPDDWPALMPGRAVWSVDDGEGTQVWIDVLSSGAMQPILERHQNALTREVPNRARAFLRAQSLQREKMYVQAAEEYAELLVSFPDSEYLRHQVEVLGQVLGIDPAALLR